jgi:hypothetical protein
MIAVDGVEQAFNPLPVEVLPRKPTRIKTIQLGGYPIPCPRCQTIASPSF